MRLGLALPLLFVLAFPTTLQGHASDLALVGAKIYLSPSEPPIESGTILVHSGHILSVGPIAEIKVPRGTTVIDCKGLVVTAGFWNSHVHILLPGLLHAEKLSSEQITSQLQEMLTRWGFTTVFDIASVLQFMWMSRAGMSFQDILASLTTNPVQRFGYATHSGRIAKGLDADLVVLSADPAQKTSAFSKVRYTIRGGEIIYAEK
jgi:imidazolonepropionase-like amidohydrolase